jgi:hypothetical protein
VTRATATTTKGAATATAHSSAAATTTATAAAAAGQYVTRHPRTHGQHRHGYHDLLFHFGVPCISRTFV